MRTYCIAQGTLLNALWQPKWEGNSKKMDICICLVDSFCCTVETNGHGSPLQCSCLENPRDGGAWWAAVYGSHRVGHN